MISPQTIATLTRRLDQAAKAGDSQALARLGQIYDATAMRSRDGKRQAVLLLLSDACLMRAAAVWSREVRSWDAQRARQLENQSADCLAGALRRVS